MAQLLKAGLNNGQVMAIQESRKDLSRRATIVDNLAISILLSTDKAYPKLLLEMADPPAAIYIRGQLNDWLAVSIVGSRNCSSYGRSIAYELAKAAAKLNITVISGLAYGIDSVAHQACLESKGKTIAVLAGGLESVYPRQHYTLAERIIAQDGALISEFPLFTRPYKPNFLIRNRIIAGLSSLTIIVEAGKNSGALTTAAYALGYHRDVMAVPGDITRPTAYGPNSLMTKGAQPYLGVNDLADFFHLNIRSTQTTIAITDEEKALIKLISREGTHLNQLAKDLQLDIADLSSKVILLELKGLIKHDGSAIYRRLG